MDIRGLETSHSSSIDPIVVLTGAGISAESGIPTFRGLEGLWRDHRPEQLATPEAFRTNPVLVWEFYAWRREKIQQAEPNSAHHLLVEIEHSSEDFTLITQNVDGLHQRAGSVNVIELHGSIWGMSCTRCDAEWEDHAVALEQIPPPCPQCGGTSRPAVVWFGETLPEAALSAAYSAASKAKTMLVIGTSAVVHPAASIPMISQNSGASLVEINIERTPLSAKADRVLLGSASECLENWWRDQQQRN